MRGPSEGAGMGFACFGRGSFGGVLVTGALFSGVVDVWGDHHDEKGRKSCWTYACTRTGYT